VAFVVDISGAAVSFAEQSFTEMANTARQAGVPKVRCARSWSSTARRASISSRETGSVIAAPGNAAWSALGRRSPPAFPALF
jgi:hypothetical protein